MNLMDNPAIVGTMMTSIAFGAWALGRWQGAAAACMALPVASPTPTSEPAHLPEAAPVAREVSAPASPCQQNAADERRSLATDVVSLADLHEDVSAYRRREQVLASLDAGMLFSDTALQDCRFVGITGEPLCPAPANVRQGCGGGGCGGRQTARPAHVTPCQPSRAVASLLRV